MGLDTDRFHRRYFACSPGAAGAAVLAHHGQAPTQAERRAYPGGRCAAMKQADFKAHGYNTSEPMNGDIAEWPSYFDKLSMRASP